MITIQNSIKFVNYSAIEKLFMMLGKLQRAHFAPSYLVESDMLRAYLSFIYGHDTE